MRIREEPQFATQFFAHTVGSLGAAAELGVYTQSVCICVCACFGNVDCIHECVNVCVCVNIDVHSASRF